LGLRQHERIGIVNTEIGIVNAEIREREHDGPERVTQAGRL
jgi:hypothetical protein